MSILNDVGLGVEGESFAGLTPDSDTTVPDPYFGCSGIEASPLESMNETLPHIVSCSIIENKRRRWTGVAESAGNRLGLGSVLAACVLLPPLLPLLLATCGVGQGHDSHDSLARALARFASRSILAAHPLYSYNHYGAR